MIECYLAVLVRFKSSVIIGSGENPSVREFRFKGYSPEQLKTLSIEALLPLLNSRQRRSLDKESRKVYE